MGRHAVGNTCGWHMGCMVCTIRSLLFCARKKKKSCVCIFIKGGYSQHSDTMVRVKFHGYSDDADKLAKAFFTEHDANKDNKLDRDEYSKVSEQFPSKVPHTPVVPTDWQMRHWSRFDRADANHDGMIDREELGNTIYTTQSMGMWLFLGCMLALVLLVTGLVYMYRRQNKSADGAGGSVRERRAGSAASSMSADLAAVRGGDTWTSRMSRRRGYMS